MMNLTLTCRGNTIDDVIEALDDVTQLIDEGHIRGTSADVIPRHGPKKILSLTCRGHTTDDVVVALHEVWRLVCQGITHGFDRRGAGRFHFRVQNIAGARRPA